MAWKCWRAKCGYRSVEFTSDAEQGTKQRKDTFRYPPPILSCSAHLQSYLHSKYRIAPAYVEQYGIKACSHDRLALPIYNPRGRLRGWNIRGTRSGQAKAMIYCHGDMPLAWFFAREPVADIVLAVEDQLSAIRIASAGLNACSLLGTNVSQDKIMEIDKVSHGKWLLALDADAIGKALLQTSRRDIRVLRLSKDAKNCTSSELVNVIQRAINAVSSGAK